MRFTLRVRRGGIAYDAHWDCQATPRGRGLFERAIASRRIEYKRDLKPICGSLERMTCNSVRPSGSCLAAQPRSFHHETGLELLIR